MEVPLETEGTTNGYPREFYGSPMGVYYDPMKSSLDSHGRPMGVLWTSTKRTRDPRMSHGNIMGDLL